MLSVTHSYLRSEYSQDINDGGAHRRTQVPVASPICQRRANPIVAIEAQCQNKYRVVAQINYDFKVVYIRFIGTHGAYNKIDAETVENDYSTNQDF